MNGRRWLRSRCERMTSQREAIHLGLCSIPGVQGANPFWEFSARILPEGGKMPEGQLAVVAPAAI